MLAEGILLTRVEEEVLQVSPDQEDETLQAGGAESDLQGLAGDDGGHLVLGHPPDNHRGQLDLRVDRQRVEGGQPLLANSNKEDVTANLFVEMMFKDNFIKMANLLYAPC